MSQTRRPLGPVLLLVVLLSLAFAPQTFLFGDTDWEKVYIPAAERLQTGEHIFRDAFVYPPFTALIPLPAAALPREYRAAQFWAMNVAAGCGLLLVGWRFTGGSFAWLPPRRECAIALLGLFAGLGFVFDVLVNRQIDMLLGGAIVCGCWFLVNRRPYTGAVLIGLATAAKCTPLLFAPYLLWVGRWKEAIVLMLVAFGANLLPDALFPPADGQLRMKVWTERIFVPILAPQRNPGDWFAGIGFNHSLSGLVTRQGTAEIAWSDGKWGIRPRENPAPPWVLKAIVAVIALGLLAVAARAARRNAGIDPLGVGMVLGLMVLLSPMSSKPHFCVLVIPAWALARAGFEQRRKWLVVSTIAAVLGILPNKDLLGGYAYDWVLWYGVIPIETLVLFAGCAWASRRGSVNRPPAAF